MTEAKVKREKWYWPTIVDVQGAVDASDKGVWAALFIAAVTFVVSTASLFLAQRIGGYDAWSYIDAAAYGLIALGIRRRSRICAVVGPLLFIVDKILQHAAFGLGILGIAIAGFFVALFIVGIKGTFEYHRLKTESAKIESTN